MHPVLERHFARFLERYSAAEVRQLPSGAAVITVPDITIPPGWNMSVATIRFIAPVGYPNAQPDCFWIQPPIQLSNGTVPKNTSTNQIPETTDTWFWFSWHLEPGQWNPNRDDLLTYFSVLMTRFEKLE